MKISSGHWDAYLQGLITAGMPANQVERFLRAGYIPQSRQAIFHALCRACDDKPGIPQVAFGGARGPGKSHSLLAQMALDDCQRAPGLKCLLLRKIGKAVRESFEDLRSRVLGHTLHRYNRSDGTILFPNSSRIILGHFKDESDIDNYLGLAYDVIGCEEATTLSKSKVRAIRTCNRTSRIDWVPRTYYSANPGGVGHAWFKRRFILEQGQPCFVSSTYRDNAFLNPGYEEALNDLTGWLRRAWRDGDWDVQAGQYYSTFDTSVHVVEPKPIPHWWECWLSLDTGWVHPSAALLYAKDEHDNVYVLDEYQRSRRLPEAHCNEFQRMLDRWDVKRERVPVVAGQDAWAKDREGRCVADTYRDAGWPLVKANMARIQGAMEVLRRLGDTEAGIEPSLFITTHCIDLIALLPVLQHDPHNPEDVLKVDADDEGQDGDDLADSLRYGIMYASRERGVTYGTLSVPR